MTIGKNIITVFNKYAAGDSNSPFPPTESWNKTVIKFAQWEDTTDRQANTNGITQVNKLISIIIPKNANTQGKKYVKPLEWTRLSTEQKLLSWTLKAEDYIFFEEVPISTITTDIIKQNRCCLIKTVDDLSDQPVLPHWEITGV